MPDQPFTDHPSIDAAGHVHPDDRARVGRWSLAMAFWALFSAMFWLYIAEASNAAVGTVNTIVGLVLTIATYGAINAVLARHAIRTGQSASLFSREIFGPLGAGLAALLIGATAIYYAVFEGSIIAVALQQYFGGGDIRWWYLGAVLYALPLVAGGVQNWMDKLNGFLLPFYLVGLVAVVVAATVKQGVPAGWLTQTVPLTGPLPGWLTSYLIFMGVWLIMMFTVDFARHGRRSDATFHSRITFGWVFYFFTFGVNGLVGIYLVSAWHTTSTETGIITAILGSLGFLGLLLILVSQTRINTANYFMASSNLQDLFTMITGRSTPRFLWVVISGVVAYLFMLTNVLSYLVQALAWQGVLITSWVSIALTALWVGRRRPVPATGPTATGARRGLSALGWPFVAWATSSAVGVVLIQQNLVPALAVLAPLITVALSVVLYLPAARRPHVVGLSSTPSTDRPNRIA